LLHPDDRAEASRKFADYLAGDTIQLYENEFRMRHADGSWVWISSRGRTLPDAEGKPTALTVGAHINISTLKEAQASLRESHSDCS
jgi:PAS domain S-box-containing protein